MVSSRAIENKNKMRRKTVADSGVAAVGGCIRETSETRSWKVRSELLYNYYFSAANETVIVHQNQSVNMM